MSNLLSVKELQKSFSEGGNEIHVLQGVNFDLAEGERLAVVGESGVGKSTLLHILGTLDRPTGGKILFGGKQLPLDDEAALCEFRNRQIGFVFQFHYLLPDFSALENVMFPALIQGIEPAQAKREAVQLLDLVG
jgi:lipoprotein-releasing system ATP-binding protein